ncbi:YbaK/EbsC family protein [Natranaerobius trueperi]|uniref:Aminoacyl-tRNA deacylase n=1 Tax=Natranaerobius trueperi TaxID=759412 RepID=A0A226BUV6_9FIRM|nr:YbaK/EbsC family protein [Natranaerobius trueperi]OWZ82651.1 aminoacyl-tRNA deacylase [Natranaerobius trueperi]
MIETKERVKDYISSFDLEVIEFNEGTTKTAQMAAEQLGVTVGQIAKSILFLVDDNPVLVVTSGDVKVHTSSLKKILGAKPKMAKHEECLQITGFSPGGLCPFALKHPVSILIDESMRRFEVVYTAAGTANTAVPITIDKLATITNGELVDVCKKND